MADRSGGVGKNALFHAPFQLATLHVASWYVGLTEVGEDNRGPMVEFFLKLAGFDQPAAWCMAFVGACAEVAASLKNEYSPLEQIKLQALVQATVDWGVRNGREVSYDDVQPGDLFAVDFGGGKFRHIGFVSEVDRPGNRIITIEGNSNDEGSREGYEVISRPRTNKASLFYMSWAR